MGSEYTWGTAKIRIEKKLREERLMWFEHVKRREESHIGRRVMGFDLPGKRKEEGQRWWNGNIKGDMKKVTVDEEDGKSQLRWRTAMYCCDPD